MVIRQGWARPIAVCDWYSACTLVDRRFWQSDGGSAFDFVLAEIAIRSSGDPLIELLIFFCLRLLAPTNKQTLSTCLCGEPIDFLPTAAKDFLTS
jgi:hypothetical protein